MDTKLVVLKLFLNELGVDAAVVAVEQRKVIQKAVFLGQQLAGVDLGYRFGWYLMGPYSPALARDYYSLDAAMAVGDTPDVSGRAELMDDVAERLRGIAHLMQPPAGTLKQPDWLELLASVSYLRRVQKLDHEKTRLRLAEEKPRLMGHIDLAFQALADDQ